MGAPKALVSRREAEGEAPDAAVAWNSRGEDDESAADEDPAASGLAVTVALTALGGESVLLLSSTQLIEAREKDAVGDSEIGDAARPWLSDQVTGLKES